MKPKNKRVYNTIYALIAIAMWCLIAYWLFCRMMTGSQVNTVIKGLCAVYVSKQIVYALLRQTFKLIAFLQKRLRIKDEGA